MSDMGDYDDGDQFNITIGAADVMEDRYLFRLKSILSEHGSIIDYSKDRATLDTGVHLYQKGSSADKKLSNSRIWMQCKGLMANTLTRSDIERLGYIPVKGISTEHIAYWCVAPEPVFLVVYVECLNEFFMHDVRQLVEGHDGPAAYIGINKGTSTKTLKLSLDDRVNEVVSKLPSHQSMRIDGPLFRGRPLGHRIDPLRSRFKSPSPKLFNEIVSSILSDHRFEKQDDLSTEGMFSNDPGQISMWRGILHTTYEWVTPVFTTFGFDEGSDYRKESPPFYAQGDVIIICHQEVLDAPRPTELFDKLVRECFESDVPILVMFNGEDLSRNFGAWTSITERHCKVPQGIGSLSYNILTSLSAFREYFGQLEPAMINHRYD